MRVVELTPNQRRRPHTVHCMRSGCEHQVELLSKVRVRNPEGKVLGFMYPFSMNVVLLPQMGQ